MVEIVIEVELSDLWATEEQFVETFGVYQCSRCKRISVGGARNPLKPEDFLP